MMALVDICTCIVEDVVEGRHSLLSGKREGSGMDELEEDEEEGVTDMDTAATCDEEWEEFDDSCFTDLRECLQVNTKTMSLSGPRTVHRIAQKFNEH